MACRCDDIRVSRKDLEALDLAGRSLDRLYKYETTKLKERLERLAQETADSVKPDNLRELARQEKALYKETAAVLKVMPDECHKEKKQLENRMRDMETEDRRWHAETSSVRRAGA
ncbi:MAG: hypothetical protein LBG71_03245 [Clostridiales Family XIII bacterium]|jgi:hypothetical protein|nr:hypothetical protein [Clostridiales Family XIII bacterium]